MAQRILVTGASGFVGRYLCRALAERSQLTEILKLDASSGTDDGRAAVDLLDRAAVDEFLDRARPDVIIHLAAQSSVARGSIDAGATWAVNVSGSLNLASAIARHTPEAVVLYVSSADVYGASFLQGPVSETTVPLPLNAYARSKRLAERIFEDILPPSAQLIIVRPFNHSGPGQGEDFVLSSFAAQVARIEAAQQDPELRVGNIDVVRDFLHVRDVVDAYICLIESASNLPSRFLCNLASQRPYALRHLIGCLQDMSSRKFKIVVDAMRVRPVDIPTATGDGKLLHAVTGWAPVSSIETLLKDLVDGWRRVCQEH